MTSPSDPTAILGQAAAHLAQGDAPAAISLLAGQIDRQPDWLDGQATLARMRWECGDADTFDQGYTLALTRQPNNADLWLGHLGLLAEANQHRRVLDRLSAARSAIGPLPALDIVEAIAASEAGDVDRADRLFALPHANAALPLAVPRIRHLIRAQRIDQAQLLVSQHLRGPIARMVWPYQAILWRLTGDANWQWLEGDPRLIGCYDLEGIDLPALADTLRTLHRGSFHPFGQSPRGGTQTDGPLLSRQEPAIRALRQALQAVLVRHAEQLPPIDPTHPLLQHLRDGLRFVGSWSIRLHDAGFHVNHVHPQGWYSSAFYVALPDALGQSSDDPAGWLALGQPPTELGLDLPPIRLVQPRPGRLALFPSILWHGTLPFAAGERLTVAFDVAPDGFV